MTYLTPEYALSRLFGIWNRHYMNVVARECDGETEMEPLADLYKVKQALARRALERAGGVKWGGHPAMGDVSIVIRRNLTEEEMAEWNRIQDEIEAMEGEINKRPWAKSDSMPAAKKKEIVSEATWADDMPYSEIQKLGEEINGQELGHVFQVTRRGVVDGPDGIYAPEVQNDDEADILIGGVPYEKSTSGWVPLNGFTGQDRYHGPVMHASEFVGGRLADHIVEKSAEWERDGSPLVWVMTSVKVPDDPEHLAGWAIFYRQLGGRT